VGIAGDAALAADVSWLMDNLRWDAQDDLARLIGDGPAHELARIGGRLAAGLRDAVGTLAGLAGRGGGRREPPGR
jgi:ubiquinone biosynthesis protein UbiJ